MSDGIPGARKAAVLLLQLGRDRAAEVLRSLDDAEIQAVSDELAQLGEIPESDALVVLTEFVDAATGGWRFRGGPRFTKDVLFAGVGPERAGAFIERLGVGSSHFAFLSGMDPAAVAALLAEEPPQVAALVVATLGPERALRLLRCLPEETQGDIAYRVATMAPPSPEVIRQVEAGLERRLVAAATTAPAPAGATPLERLVALLGSADAATEASILARLDAVDPPLAAEVRKHLLTFDDLTRLDDKSMQLVLREVDTRTLALALKGAGDGIRSKVTSNLSERAGANLTEEIELLGPQRKADVEAARQAVITTVRELEAAGTIVLSRGQDDYVD